MDNNNGTENFYALFGVSPKATREDIKIAYRNKLKEWHPDKNPERNEEAEEMTKILNQAYSILSDPVQRKNYDKMLRFTKGKNFNTINDKTFWSKMEKASPTFKKTLDNVRELYSLFRDTVKRNYKLHPLTLGAIGGGLLYFLTPIDFIPDIIPIFGYLDDMAILTTLINTLQGELEAYKEWKKKETE